MKILKKTSYGFSLIELIVVITLLTILLSITLIAINPFKQFNSANNTQRRSNLKAISDALYQYASDNGNFPIEIDETVRIMGTSTQDCAISCGEGGSGTENTINLQVNDSYDDAEEQLGGDMDTSSSDLELVDDNSTMQKVGIRFQNISVPSGATINSASLDLNIDEYYTEETNLIIWGESNTNGSEFTSTPRDISDRTLTNSSINWNSLPALSVGSTLSSPDISTIIQEIVDLSGWTTGNSMVLIIDGTGKRVVESYNGSTSRAPILNINYTYNSQTYDISIQVNSGEDDGEETKDSETFTSSSDLELVIDGNYNQEVGIRFENVNIPRNSVITSAIIEFTVDVYRTGSANLNIYGEDTDNAQAYTSSQGDNISSRTKTSNQVSWTNVAEPNVGEALYTPDVSNIVTEIVERSDWNSGNSISFIITGDGIREVESYDGSSSGAPKIQIVYTSYEETPESCIDLSSYLTPTYLSDIPIDPELGSSENTYYGVSTTSQGRLKVVSCTSDSNFSEIVR